MAFPWLHKEPCSYKVPTPAFMPLVHMEEIGAILDVNPDQNDCPAWNNASDLIWPIRPAGEIYNAKRLTQPISFLIGTVSCTNGRYAADKMLSLSTIDQ